MFTTANLDAQQGRYAVIAEAALPGLILLIGGYYYKQKHSSNLSDVRESTFLMGLLWFLLVAAWTIALVLTAMDETSVMTVALVGSFSFVSLMVCWYWLSMEYKDRENASRSLFVAIAAGVATTICAVNGTGPQDSTTVASLFYGLITVCFGAASLIR